MAEKGNQGGISRRSAGGKTAAKPAASVQSKKTRVNAPTRSRSSATSTPSSKTVTERPTRTKGRATSGRKSSKAAESVVRDKASAGRVASSAVSQVAGLAEKAIPHVADAVVGKARGIAHGLGLGKSTVHVDLVKNEWLAGYQVVVARVSLSDDRLRIDASDEQWREVALRPLGTLDPSRDPQAFLEHMAEHIHGTYLFATEPHDDASCPYSNVMVPMRSIDPPGRHF